MGSSLSTSQMPPDVNHGAGILAVAWVGTTLGLSTLLACLCGRRISKTLRLDDLILCFAALMALACSILVTIQVQHGFGRHYQFLTPSNIRTALEMIWLAQPFSLMSVSFGKIAASLLLLRIPSVRDTWFQRGLLWSIMASVFCVNLSVIPVAFLQCSPTSYLWTQYSPGSQGTCWNPNITLDLGTFQSAYSALTDLILTIIPIILIRNLKMPLLLKAGVSIIVILGLLSTVCAALKAWQLQKVMDRDFSAVQVPFTYCYLSETWLIIIAASLPGLKSLVHRPRFESDSPRQHLSISEASEGADKADEDIEELKSCAAEEDHDVVSRDDMPGLISGEALRPDMCMTSMETNRASTGVSDLQTLLRGEGLGNNQILRTTVICVS